MRLAFALLVLCAVSGAGAQKRVAQDPWWQRETAMSADGRLMLDAKPWWPKAVELKDGEKFTLDVNGDGRPDVVVARVGKDIVEAIDDTGKAADVWNQVSTTYVVSFDGTGKVDRIVSYIDGAHRGKADEIELRYFRDGYLRYAWFGKSYGGDAAKIFAMNRWGYAGNDKGSEFRGNAQIYINKYDATTKSWQPLSECPFSFWDIDGDGRTDVTLRVSAAPRGSLHGPDTDYANNYDYMWAKDATPVAKMGATNMRLSFNIDGTPRADDLTKPHSNFSFTMTGDQPYAYAGMQDFNPARRYPQTTVHMPWSAKWTAALRYASSETGFTWDEARTNFRWEGQFWIYEREYLSNTGSPNERWNMRREFTNVAQAGPKMYFSAADQRYHMEGAQEGWLEVGHVIDESKQLEFRWWDSDGDGKLDTVEVYRGNETTPARVAHFAPKARDVAIDRTAMAAEYNGNVLPAAIAADEALISSLHSVVDDVSAHAYETAAASADAPERKRYLLDVARELLYLDVRDLMAHKQAVNPYNAAKVDAKRFRDPAPGNEKQGYTLGDSMAYWASVKLLHAMDAAYAEGEFRQVDAMLSRVSRDGSVRDEK